MVGTVWPEQPDAGAAVERHLGVWVTRGRLGTAQEKGLLETLYPVSPKGGGPFSVSKAQADLNTPDLTGKIIHALGPFGEGCKSRNGEGRVELLRTRAQAESPASRLEAPSSLLEHPRSLPALDCPREPPGRPGRGDHPRGRFHHQHPDGLAAAETHFGK